jgi:hypothetical protein
MMQYPNLSLTLLLGFILLPPFVLTTRYGIEPYPAIILPSGANKANVSPTQVSFNRTSLWGKHKEKGIWVRVDLETFLNPISVNQWNGIAVNSFGLKSPNAKIIKGFNTKKVTTEEVQSGKQWLRQKLSQFGYASDELMITFDKETFDIAANKIITSNKMHEEILRLD